MKKEFLGGALFSVGINLLVKTVWILGIELAVQRTVGTEQYGMYFSLFNFSLLFLIALDLGITNFNTRNIARHRHLLQKNFSPLILFKIALGILYMLILGAASLLMGYDAQRLQLLAFLAGTQFFASMTLYLRSNISALHRFRLDGMLSVADRLLLILVCSIWFLLERSFSVFDFVRIQFSTSALAMLLAFAANLRFTAFPKPRWNTAIFAVILKQSLPFALLVLIMSLYSRVDAVLIDYLRADGEVQAGIYAAAFRLFDAYSQIALIFTGILLPVFARQLKLSEDTGPVLSTALSVLLFAALSMAIAGTWYGDVLANLLYKEYIPETGTVLSILLWALVPFVLSMTLGSLITASGNMRALNVIAVTTLAANLALNFALIPSLGAKGAACTAICVHGISALLLGFTAYRRLGASPGRSLAVRVLLFLAVNIATGYFTLLVSGGITGMLILAGTLVITGWACGLLPVAEIKNMILKEKKLD